MLISPNRPSKDAVLQFVKTNGPSVPNDVMRRLGSDTFLIGAYLSELVGEKKLAVSAMKVGGSPLYYAPGHEFKLQEFTKYLNEKDRMAYDLLKDKRVLKDKDLSPLLRVSCRMIKDFAKELDFDNKGEKELYWRYYLITDEQAQEELKQLNRPQEAPKPAPVKLEIKETIAEKPLEKPKVLPKQEPQKIEKPKQETLTPEIKELKKEAEPKETPDLKKEMPPEGKPKKETPEKIKTTDDTSNFIAQIKTYFSQNNIDIIDMAIIKKSSEADFVIKVPSAVGKLTFYCKAKGKKTINEGDLSSAYVTGETKKLPILFLTTGKLTKKAKDMLVAEFKNIIVKELP